MLGAYAKQTRIDPVKFPRMRVELSSLRDAIYLTGTKRSGRQKGRPLPL
jgi:hypothetical protein